jgi:hypothetical protein
MNNNIHKIYNSYPQRKSYNTFNYEHFNIGKAITRGTKDAGKAITGGAKDAGKAITGGAKDAGKAITGGAKDAGGFFKNDVGGFFKNDVAGFFKNIFGDINGIIKWISTISFCCICICCLSLCTPIIIPLLGLTSIIGQSSPQEYLQMQSYNPIQTQLQPIQATSNLDF